MNILIAGATNSGCTLARRLEAAGHEISIVDPDPELVNPLHNALLSGFSGLTTCGYIYDADVLRRASIESCDAVVAASRSEDANLMCVQVAAVKFGIKNGIARVQDPEKGEIFEKMGIHTVCPTSLMADLLTGMLDGEDR